MQSVGLIDEAELGVLENEAHVVHHASRQGRAPRGNSTLRDVHAITISLLMLIHCNVSFASHCNKMNANAILIM